MKDRLPRRFYARDPLTVARDLLGRVLVHRIGGRILAGRIVEAEAYGPQDPASHAFRGPTRRNASMFGPPGHAYVYVSHGIHHCLNATTGAGSAVLIRALQPLEGIGEMARRRGQEDLRLLCAGPGRLCQALGITVAEDGADLTNTGGMWIAPGDRAPQAVATPRIGVTLAADVPWRFVVPGSPFLSRPVSRTPRRA
ncbi:MAG: DNA-3-methyladenine glycosylase [Actinomycetota bacterium]